MKRLLLATLLLAPTHALAEGTYLHAGAWSQHMDGDELNESHSLVAVEVDSYMAGYFRNSYDEDSVFAAKRWAWNHGNWQASISVGAVYGYRSCLKGIDDNGRKLCPLVSPSLTYTKYAVQPSLLVLGNAVALSIRTDLDAIGEILR